MKKSRLCAKINLDYLKKAVAAIKSDVKILFADENQNFADICTSVLLSGGYNVVPFSGSGVDLCDYILKNSPDIVIMNINFSKLDGLGIMRKILNTVGNITKFVIYSSSANFNTRSEIAQWGASFVIKTPFDFSAMFKKIDFLIDEILKEKRYITPNLGENLSRTDKDANLEFEIIKILTQLGIPPQVKGFFYLKEAILLTVKDYRFIGAVTKELYPKIALYFNTTPSRVEKAIRNCIERLWEKGDFNLLSIYFKPVSNSSFIEKPSNAEFIAVIAEKLRYLEFNKAL